MSWRQGLREETGLDLLGDLELLCGAALGLDLFGGDLTLLFDFAGELVGADQLEAVAVDVLKTGEGDAEDRLLWRLVEAHAVLLPELVGGVDVLGDEADLSVAADEPVFVGAGFGSDEREDGLTIRRGDCDPTSVVGESDVGEDAEAKVVDVEIEAAFVIADVDGGFEDAQVGALRTLRAVGACRLREARGGGFEDFGCGFHNASPLGSRAIE